MTFDFLAPIVPVAPIAEPAVAGTSALPPMVAPGATGAASFDSMVSDGLSQVSQKLQASEVDLQNLAAGHADNLHQIMIRLEESRLSFQLMLQVRNRLLESYQDVMRMQV